MAMKRIEILLVVAMVVSAVGCGTSVSSGGDPAPETRAEGTWVGDFYIMTESLGFLELLIDEAGKVIGGSGGLSGVGNSNVKSGSLRANGSLEVDFANGSSFRCANATLSEDGNTMSGSGTFRTPDGISQTVFFTLERPPRQ